jgi:ABC-type antimicrobial peptide transport system permease subunit
MKESLAMDRISKLKCFILIILVPLLIFSTVGGFKILLVNSSSQSYQSNSNLYQVTNILKDINWTNIEVDTKFFSSLGSRVLGYPGCEKAADYIFKKFNQIGLNTTQQEFQTVAPIDEGSVVYIPSLNKTIKAFALWPRGGIQEQVVRNLTGKLFYAGSGTFDELNGVNISNAIVLMNFNSGNNWLNAISLGAKAVIFMQPNSTDKFEALAKGTSAPLNAVLLYVNKNDGELLKNLSENHSLVTISSSLVWKKVTGRNIIGKLYGESKSDVIIISAHYDSWSIVPSVSPAAEDAVSIATLLELARVFSSTNLKLQRTIWFVAYSGHWEGTIGPIEFVEHTLLNTSDRVWLQISLDLSSETPFVDFIYFNQIPYMGAVYSYASTLANRFGWIQSIASSELSKISLEEANLHYENVNVTSLNGLVSYNFLSGSYWGTQPDMIYLLDSFPLMQAAGMSITIRTQYARRMSWLSPLNDYNLINWENIKPQVMVVASSLYVFSSYPDLGVSYDSIKPTRFAVVGQAPLGFALLKGTTAVFNFSTGWYTPLSNCVVRLYIYPNIGLETNWPFVYTYALSDRNGRFTFHGLDPLSTYTADAWKFDKNGNIEYALDYGYTGTSQGVAGGISNTAFISGTTGSMLIPLFKCVSLSVFRIFDVERMERWQVPDPRNNFNLFDSTGTTFSIWDANSKSLPVFYSYYLSPGGIATVFVQKGQRIVITNTVSGWPQIILSNSTSEYPEGTGLLVDSNMLLYKTELMAANDMINTVKSRYKNFEKFDVRNEYLEHLLNASERYLNLAKYSAENNLWSYYYGNISFALNLAYKGYNYVLMPLYGDTSNSVVVLAFFILPFSILFERAIVRQSSWKRIISILVIASLFFAVFALVHPAFTVMSNATFSILGVGVFLLLISVILILMGEISELMRSYAVSKLGFHEYRTETLSVLIHTMSTASENIRRRPIHSFLAFFTIATFTAGLVALTSTSYTYSTYAVKTNIRPYFQGILIKSGYGFPPVSTGGGILDVPLLNLLQASFSKDYVVSPRVWLYPQFIYPLGNVIRVSKAGDYKNVYNIVPAAILGISSEELRIMLSNYSEIPLSNLSESQIILPKTVSDFLNLKPGDKVYLWGYGTFTLAGTVAISTQIFDPDGYPWLPIDPGFSSTLTLSSFTYPSGMTIASIVPTNLVIMNWKTALKYGGFISSIAMIAKTNTNEGEILETAKQLVDFSPIQTVRTTLVCTKESAVSMAKVLNLRFAGGVYLFTVGIALFSILNFMLGTVTERRREIYAYQALGISPMGALVMFVTEFATIALGGVLIGYLVGLGLDRVFLALKMLPAGFYFNFVSSTVFLSMLVVVSLTILVSLYPASLASRMITPSLERKWKPESKPKGNAWDLGLPLMVKEKTEAVGFLRYAKEYFSEAGYVGPGYRVMKIGNVNPDKLTFDFDVVLTPIETGVTQHVNLYFRMTSDYRYQLAIYLELVSGDRSFFESRNYSFLDALRNQALLWRSLPQKERERYISML